MGSLHFRFREVWNGRRGGRFRNVRCGKFLDVDFRRPALSLLDALDQRKATLSAVQFRQQPNGLVVSAHQVCLNFVQRVIDINAPKLVIPAVFGRQAHPVEHQPIKQLRFGGERLEFLAPHQQPRDAEVAELLGFLSVKIGEIDLRLQKNHLDMQIFGTRTAARKTNKCLKIRLPYSKVSKHTICPGLVCISLASHLRYIPKRTLEIQKTLSHADRQRKKCLV